MSQGLDKIVVLLEQAIADIEEIQMTWISRGIDGMALLWKTGNAGCLGFIKQLWRAREDRRAK